MDLGSHPGPLKYEIHSFHNILNLNFPHAIIAFTFAFVARAATHVLSDYYVPRPVGPMADRVSGAKEGYGGSFHSCRYVHRAAIARDVEIAAFYQSSQLPESRAPYEVQYRQFMLRSCTFHNTVSQMDVASATGEENRTAELMRQDTG